MTELEKIDALRERMGISYSEAKFALDGAEGDLIQALIDLERENLSAKEQFKERGMQTWGTLKESVSRAGRAKIKLKKGPRTVFTIPAPIGAIGLVGAMASTTLAVVGLTGTAFALANKYTLEIDSEKNNEEGFDNPNPGDI